MTTTYQAGRGAQQRGSISAILCLIRFDVLRSLGTWRWLLVLPIYGVVGSFYGGLIKFDIIRQQLRSVNWWDVPPVVAADPFLTVWFIAVGFVLLIGDSFVRDYTQHSLALTLTRSASRMSWWIAKISSIGVLALCYVALMFSSILVGSLFSVPFAFSDSAQSLIATTGSDGWYFRLMNVPMPLFVVLIALYLALVLWVLGSIVLTSSLIVHRPLVPLAVTLGWALIGRALRAQILSSIPYLSLLDISYFVTYAKHLAPYDHLPLPTFILIAVGALLVTLAFGAWKLRRLDV